MMLLKSFWNRAAYSLASRIESKYLIEVTPFGRFVWGITGDVPVERDSVTDREY